MAISKDNFRFVPYFDYSRTWTDEELFERYHCTEEEIRINNDFVIQSFLPLETDGPIGNRS